MVNKDPSTPFLVNIAVIRFLTQGDPLIICVLLSSIAFFPLLLLFSPITLIFSLNILAISILTAIISLLLIHKVQSDKTPQKGRPLFFFSVAFLASLLFNLNLLFLIATVNSSQKKVLSSFSANLLWICEISPPGLIASLYLFTLSTLSCLCLSFVFLSPGRLLKEVGRLKILFLAIGVFVLVCLLQLILSPTYKLEELSFSLFWVTIPVFTLLYWKRLLFYMPLFMVALWSMNISHSVLQITRCNEVVGMAGNRNWNASFTIVTTFFTCYALSQAVRKLALRLVDRGRLSQATWEAFKFLPLSIVVLMPLIPSSYVVYKCDSRGAILGLVAIFLLCGFLHIPKQRYEFKLRLVLYSALVIVSLLALLKSGFASLCEEDVRIPLWTGCLEMTADHPVIGVGSGGFESAFAPYRPLDYFQKTYVAVRSNHPHNILLYILACFGVLGFAAWAVIWVYPLVSLSFHYQQTDVLDKVVYYSFALLFTHGFFDLILFEWPTIVIGAILVGMLWGKIGELGQPSQSETLVPPTSQTAQHCPIWIPLTIRGFGFFILFLTVAAVRNDVLASYYHRSGEFYELRGQKELTLFYFDKALDFKISPKFIYKAAICAYVQQQNPELSLKYFALFDETPFRNFAHNHGFIALCLRKVGKTAQALPHLEQETRNYPLLTGAWFNLAQAQQELKLPQAQQSSFKNMHRTLEVKELTQEALPYLLKNPEYDMRPGEMPAELLQKLRKTPPLGSARRTD